MRFCTGSYGLGGPEPTTLSQIPVLFMQQGISPTRDVETGITIENMAWNTRLAAGAPWTLAIEPDAPEHNREVFAVSILCNSSTMPGPAARITFRG